MYENSISDACLIREIRFEDIFGLTWHLTIVKIEKSGQNFAFVLFAYFTLFQLSLIFFSVISQTRSRISWFMFRVFHRIDNSRISPDTNFSGSYCLLVKRYNFDLADFKRCWEKTWILL